MHLSGLDFFFWVAGFVGHVALLFVLLWRKRALKYPIFATLIGVNLVRTVVLYCVLAFGNRRQYYFTYWSLAMVDAVLQFSVVYEMAAKTLRPLGTWARDVKSGFAALIALSLAIAAGLTWLANPPTRLLVQTVVIKGNFFSEVCMSELFVGILALSVTAGLPWKTHAAKISLGLGAYSMIEVLIEGGHNYFGLMRDSHVYQFLAHIRMGVYVCCLCYWTLALWPEEPASRPLTGEMNAQLLEIRRRVREDLERLRSGDRRE
jgi:hypothetical protein